MLKRCSICSEKIEEEWGKLKGTVLRVINLKGKRGLIYACSDCQKEEGWIEKAKVRGV